MAADDPPGLSRDHFRHGKDDEGARSEGGNDGRLGNRLDEIKQHHDHKYRNQALNKIRFRVRTE